MNVLKFLKNFTVGAVIVAGLVIVPTLIGMALEYFGIVKNVERSQFYWFAGFLTIVAVGTVTSIGAVCTGDIKFEGDGTGYDY